MTPAAFAGPANAGLPRASANPLASVPWGVDQDPTSDDLWKAYTSAKGKDHQLLGKIATQPHAVWLGYWDNDTWAQRMAAQTVARTTKGNPNVLTQFATFALNPWEGSAAPQGWNVAQVESWYRALAAGIGNARASVIVQVDLPDAVKDYASNAQISQIDTYAVKTLSALPHTTVYLDGGTYGWLPSGTAARMLIDNGVQYARGFALNDTQYMDNNTELKYGGQVVDSLKHRGVDNKHFVLNTDENGQPYGSKQVHGNSNDTPMCHGKIQRVCQRTGVPPTTDVANRAWHLSRSAGRIAKRDADAYVWSGRPWNVNGGPFRVDWALELARNGEYIH
ncbi:MAG: glycoside hydrolase family 6 protein [Solirubrobacterales bacterium]|nr:glycoside hydrolase family 6 protein [Solirubrobacterales bacterium]